ncbi:AAA family ATPase [Rubripirellula amarantea]|nr:AAA family ATPase [Rubripirellula amarantea]
MPVRIDASELIDLLQATPADQNIMLVGRHGIGKSQIITSHFENDGMQVVSFFLGQMSDPGDLIGLLHKDAATGRSDFLPPYWWPEPDQPIVLFLDELNRARPEILQAVMELALNKRLAGKRLPAGSRIVSAVNEGDEYQLTDLDPALVSRFNLYEFAPTLDDWLLWAAKAGIDTRVAAFIENQPQYLDGIGLAENAPDQDAMMSGLVKTPDRRGWERVSNLIADSDNLSSLHIKLIAGIVGSSAANAFRKSLAPPLPVTPEEVLLNFAKKRKVIEKMLLPELVLLNTQILRWISNGSCPEPHAEKARAGLLSHLKLIRKRKLDEAVAHFVSQVDKPKFEPAMAFVSESIELTSLMTDYMDGIRVD